MPLFLVAIPMAFLVAENGSGAGQRHSLTKGRYILGRHPECDIVVDAGAVSRHHAQLFRVGDDFYVEDMNSRNGTYLDGKKIELSRLRANQHIRMGKSELVYHEKR